LHHSFRCKSSLSFIQSTITTVDKAKVAGDYNVSLKYANATGSSKTMSIFVNGTRVKQTTLPNLVNWDTWGTQTELLPLTSGNNIITIKYYPDTGDTGNIKLDYITIPFEPFISLYQAECNKLSGGASINRNHLFYSGAAFVDGFTAVGANISFEDIYVPTAGSYKVNIRYANGGTSAKTLSTYVNGSKVSQISLPKLSSWDTWGTHEQTVTLNAGKNIISYQYDSGDTANVNIDRILVYSSVSVTPASEVNLLDDPGFERPISYTTKWVEWHPAGQNLAYGRDSGSSSNPPESPKTGDMRAWFNLPSAFKQSIHQTLSVPNGVYKVEALVKYFGKTATACRLEIDYDTAVNISKDGVWKYISAIKSVTSGQIDIGFYVDSPGETVLLVDDVKLYRLD